MTRRAFLSLSAAAAAAATMPVRAWAAESTANSGSEKKGLGFGVKNPDWAEILTTLRCKSNPAALVKRLGNLHKMYKRPLWITEFAVGDWQAASVEENKHSALDVLRFMDRVLPMLDRLDFLERYAWFPAQPDNRALGTSALFDADGVLTPLGECYRDG